MVILPCHLGFFCVQVNDGPGLFSELAFSTCSSSITAFFERSAALDSAMLNIPFSLVLVFGTSRSGHLRVSCALLS